MTPTENVDLEALNTLIEEVSASGGAETANTQIFIERLTKALSLPTPDFAGEENEHNDYTFERRVDFKFPDGSTSIGRIDCYKRDCFVLEAKQSSKRKRDTRQLDMLGEDAKQKKLGTAKRGTGGWDKSMRAARKQAENYARALPVSHGYPPFLLVLDVGNVLEVYADFSGQGKNYAQFPDRNSYRLSMDDLREADIQERLQKIWQDPQSLNPALISAVVTREIASRLAKIAKRLEGDYDSEVVAHFLMRCLFTMFAEDVKLIEEKSFENLLLELKDKPDQFVPLVESLWKDMNDGGYSAAIRNTVRHFNGGLFANCRALPLEAEAIHELWLAAKRDWSDVEPAIFGTLLEQALDPRERGKLGAHYTPRAYVERLVIPTIIEPLRGDWEDVLARVNELHDADKDDEALEAVKTFHHELCTTRVLDPACGTGNFLYVGLELMKRLEGEVLETLDDLGLADPKLAFEGETVTPRQFFGLDLNERAVAIADLVLWLGHIKWQLKTSGLDSISDPVLEKLGNIRHQDAILDYDRKTPACDEYGKPITRWNGYSYKKDPISGKDVPDLRFQTETYIYENPKAREWPKADFIVGNPPFIGNKPMRRKLGDDYVDVLRSVYSNLPSSMDLVMFWWAKCADSISKGVTRSFGLVTTSSITQEYGSRQIQSFLDSTPSAKIVFAIADHPWPDSKESADLRIAFHCIDSSERRSRIETVSNEDDLENILYEEKAGLIDAKLRIGVDLSKTSQLLSNQEICTSGVTLVGKGFRIPKGNVTIEDEVLKLYANGSDINGKSREERVIDTYHISEDELLKKFPRAYQHLSNTVKKDRDAKRGRNADADTYAKYWWKFAKERAALRDGISDLATYVVSTQTSKHRFFSLISGKVIPDIKLIAFVFNSADLQSILTSRIHWVWVEPNSGRLGKGNDPVYSTRKSFNPFPFPSCLTDNSEPTLQNRLSKLGEQLDEHRKRVLEQHVHLTMTGIYNTLERVRELESGIGEPLSDAERDIYDVALVGILKEIHDDIDRATLEAYGWSDLAHALIGKVGSTLPSPHKSSEQEAAEEELLSRLVTLNIERREEERTGKVRWLRPDYQIPKLGHKVKAETKDMNVTPIVSDDAPAWPKDGLDQIKVVRELLARSDAPVLPDAVSATFKGRNSPKRKTRVVDVLETLVATGLVRKTEDKQTYFIAK